MRGNSAFRSFGRPRRRSLPRKVAGMDPRHRELAEIALRAAGGDYGLALAGGYAVREHGMGDRPSGDVDLFTDWQRRADFPAAADLVIEALTDHGFLVHVVARADTFARLLISRVDEPDAKPQKMELAADWRAHPPVALSVGPVLHPDDAVGNKMAALYGLHSPATSSTSMPYSPVAAIRAISSSG